MDNRCQQDFKLYYRDEENGQWKVWAPRQGTLDGAESEARKLIGTKGALEVKVAEVIRVNGVEHETEALFARLNDWRIEVTKGLKLKMQRELEQQQELKRRQECERTQESEEEQVEGYGYGYGYGDDDDDETDHRQRREQKGYGYSM